MVRGEPMIKPTIQAALCILALGILHRLGFVLHVSAVDVVRALGVARSTAYEHEVRLRAQLVDDSTAETPPPTEGDDAAFQRLRIENAVLRYRVEHPGCWVDGGRTVYSDELRTFVLELAVHEGVGERITQEKFAEACGIPLPTFKPWWVAHRATPSATAGTQSEPSNATETPDVSNAAEQLDDDCQDGADGNGEHPTQRPPAKAGFTLEMLRIVKEWDGWHGTFDAFVRKHLRSLGVHHGKKLVSDLLHLAGARKLLRRPPPKPAARGSTFVPPPGVQWSSDGKEIRVVVGRQTFTMSLQPMVDVGSTAKVGVAVRPTEDAAGVAASFHEGVVTTGNTPRFLLLDNKAPNKSAELKAAVPESTVIMYGTRGRGQSKATVEGDFGLFAQDLGPVIAVVDDASPERVALSVGEAVARAFYIGRNHRIRRKDGKTPYELYREADPSPEEVTAAVDKLHGIKERIEAREQREAARRDPYVRATLEEACARFGLTEDGDLLDSLSTLPLESVQAAVAIFKAKGTTGSLPKGVGLRYLAGIARNHHHARELELFETELVSLLEREQVTVMAHFERKAASFESLDLAPRVGAIVNELLIVNVPLAQVFWRRQLATVAASAPIYLHTGLRRWLCERIRRRFRATKEHRQQLIELVVRLFAPEAVPVAAAHC